MGYFASQLSMKSSKALSASALVSACQISCSPCFALRLHGFVNPATQAPGLGTDLFESHPESQSPISDGQLRWIHAALLEFEQDFSPTLGGFPGHSVGVLQQKFVKLHLHGLTDQVLDSGSQHLTTAVSLACSPSVRHSPTEHQHEGNVRPCSQQVLQELLAIGNKSSSCEIE